MIENYEARPIRAKEDQAAMSVVTDGALASAKEGLSVSPQNQIPSDFAPDRKLAKIRHRKLGQVVRTLHHALPQLIRSSTTSEALGADHPTVSGGWSLPAQ